jgi:hypothetical protein
MTGSADHYQHAELSDESLDLPARRFPHIFTQGPWNQYGFDAGLPNEMKLVSDNIWNFNFMAEWPSTVVSKFLEYLVLSWVLLSNSILKRYTTPE